MNLLARGVTPQFGAIDRAVIRSDDHTCGKSSPPGNLGGKTMSAQHLRAARTLGAFAIVFSIAACSAEPTDSASPSASVLAAPEASNTAPAPTTGPTQPALSHGERAADWTTDLSMEPAANYSLPALVEAFADCEAITQETDYLLLSCDETFGIEITPTMVSLIGADVNDISPTVIERYASALAESIGIGDGGAGVESAINELVADQTEAPGSATTIEVAPGWELAITGMAEGATMFTALGSTPTD